MSDKAITIAEFEAFCIASYPTGQDFSKDSAGNYTNGWMMGAFFIWQAAKEQYAPKWISVDDKEPPHGVRCLFMERGTEHVISSFPHKRIWEEQGHDLWMPLPQLGDKE